MLILREQFCTALAKGHHLTAAHLHPPHKKYPHPNQKQDGKPAKQ
jgi:hypothetical protein